jgi:hypothetical protein
LRCAPRPRLSGMRCAHFPANRCHTSGSQSPRSDHPSKARAVAPFWGCWAAAVCVGRGGGCDRDRPPAARRPMGDRRLARQARPPPHGGGPGLGQAGGCPRPLNRAPRYGRKVRLKVGDIEAEAQTREEVENFSRGRRGSGVAISRPLRGVGRVIRPGRPGGTNPGILYANGTHRRRSLPGRRHSWSSVPLNVRFSCLFPKLRRYCGCRGCPSKGRLLQEANRLALMVQPRLYL